MKHKLVTVKWKDSANFKEWYNYEELDSLVIDDVNITSTGYLVAENKDWIILAGNIDDTSCSSIDTVRKPSRCPRTILLLRKVSEKEVYF